MSTATVRDRPRCFPQTGALETFDYATEIKRHASLLVTRFPPSPHTFRAVEPDVLGLYAGPTSIAYGLYTQRASLPPIIEGRTPLEWAQAYLDAGRSLAKRADVGPKMPRPTDSSCCGIFSERLGWAVTAAAVHGDPTLLEPLFECAPRLLDLPPPERRVHRSGMPQETFDDLEMGRAGYLFLLRFAKHHFPAIAPRVDALVPQVIDAMVARGPDSKYGWRWVLGHFLGVGHGWVGNIVQILLSDPSAQRARQCRPWLLQVIRDQLPNGNWGRYMSPDDPQNPDPLKTGDLLVQISAGAPGVVVGLLAVRGIYEEHGDAEIVGSINQAVSSAQDCIWTRGLLTKESCIFNGAAGNAMALLDPARQATFLTQSTQERVDRGVQDGTLEASDSPSDLQRGLAGRIWIMVALSEGRAGTVPAFNDF